MKRLFVGFLVLGSICAFASDELPNNFVVNGSVNGTISILKTDVIARNSITAPINERCTAVLKKETSEVAHLSKTYEISEIRSGNRYVPNNYYVVSYAIFVNDPVLDFISCSKFVGRPKQRTYGRLKNLIGDSASIVLNRNLE